MSIDIIPEALKYYDENAQKYKHIKKHIKFINNSVDTKKDIEGVKLDFFDKDMNILFTSRLEIIGKYYGDIKVWVWGWSIPTLDKYFTSIIRKVFLYGTDIIINNNVSNVLLKNELITSRFRIDDDIQIDIHCAIASYLAKKPFIVTLNDNIFDSASFEIANDADIYDKSSFEIANDDNAKSTIFYAFVIDPPDI